MSAVRRALLVIVAMSAACAGEIYPPAVPVCRALAEGRVAEAGRLLDGGVDVNRATDGCGTFVDWEGASVLCVALARVDANPVLAKQAMDLIFQHGGDVTRACTFARDQEAVDTLAPLFHDKSKFVHMSGTWKKDEELDIIKTGRIWQKQTEVHDVAAEVFDNTAVVWSRITLSAIVRGTDAKTEFTVTEVYQRQGSEWTLPALMFSSVRDTHQIQK